MMSTYLSDSSLQYLNFRIIHNKMHQENIKFLRFAKTLFSSSRKNFIVYCAALVCLAFTIGNGIEFYKDLKKQMQYIHKIENEINIFNNKKRISQEKILMI